jgi:hypothetical protein
METTVISKLQYKGQSPVLIVQHPPEFRPIVDAWKKLAAVETRIGPKKTYGFSLCFVQSEADIRTHAVDITRHLEDDGIFWVAYPKKSSKKYQATITRDQGWQALGELGFEGVRMVAIDEDWSALRLRKAEKIAKMIRRQDMAMSAAGKSKTSNKTNKAIRGK